MIQREEDFCIPSTPLISKREARRFRQDAASGK